MAPFDGRVVRTADTAGGPFGIWVESEKLNLRARLMHLDGLVKGIESGAEVKAGQQLGILGAQGTEGFPHLHLSFERLSDGERINPALFYRLKDPSDPFSLTGRWPDDLATPTPAPTVVQLPEPIFGQLEVQAASTVLQLIPGLPGANRATVLTRVRVTSNAKQGFRVSLYPGTLRSTAADTFALRSNPSSPNIIVRVIPQESATSAAASQPRDVGPQGMVIAESPGPLRPGETLEMLVELTIEADMQVDPGVYLGEFRFVYEPRYG